MPLILPWKEYSQAKALVPGRRETQEVELSSFQHIHLPVPQTHEQDSQDLQNFPAKATLYKMISSQPTHTWAIIKINSYLKLLCFGIDRELIQDPQSSWTPSKIWVTVLMLNNISVKIIANILPVTMRWLPMEIYYSLCWRNLSNVHVEEHIQTVPKKI